HLDTYRFGVLMMLLSFVNFAAIGIGWMSGGMQRLFAAAYAANAHARFAEIFTASKWIFMGYAAILGAAAVASSALLAPTLFHASANTRNDVIGGIAGAAVYLIALYGFNVDRVALTSRGRQAAANLLFILGQLLSAGLTLPVLWSGGGLFGVLL